MDHSLPGSSVHGDSPGKNTGVGCHALLLQGIFPAQGSNLHFLRLLHWQAGALPLVPPGKPFSHIDAFKFKIISIEAFLNLNFPSCISFFQNLKSYSPQVIITQYTMYTQSQNDNININKNKITESNLRSFAMTQGFLFLLPVLGFFFLSLEYLQQNIYSQIYLFNYLFWSYWVAFRISIPQTEIKPGVPAWKCQVLTTRSSGNSLNF